MHRRHWLTFPVLVVAIWVIGCSGGGKSVKGVVKLDGSPVAGATVTFTSEDGKNSYDGFTDSSGNFELRDNQQKSTNIVPGNYKVIVIKRPAMEGGEAMMNPGSPEARKAFEKEMKDAPAAKPGMPPGMPPGKMGMPDATVKSELPQIYATFQTTPLTVKVPPDNSPVQIDLKSKP